MKKTIRLLSLSLVAVMMALALTACLGGLSGKYVAKAGIGGLSAETSYEFSGDSYTHNSIFTTETGKYAVEDNKIYFWGADETREDAQGTSFNKGSDNNGSYIEIGGVKYYKE